MKRQIKSGFMMSGGIDIPDELPPLMVRLQAKVDIANDFLHSNWDKTIQLGRKMEAEVVQAVKDMLSAEEPETVGELTDAAYMQCDYDGSDWRDLRRTEEDNRL
jgi:hypothetical protein